MNEMKKYLVIISLLLFSLSGMATGTMAVGSQNPGMVTPVSTSMFGHARTTGSSAAYSGIYNQPSSYSAGNSAALFSTSSLLGKKGNSSASGGSLGGGLSTMGGRGATSLTKSDWTPSTGVGEITYMGLDPDDEDDKPKPWEDPYMTPLGEVPFLLIMLLAVAWAVRRKLLSKKI